MRKKRRKKDFIMGVCESKYIYSIAPSMEI